MSGQAPQGRRMPPELRRYAKQVPTFVRVAEEIEGNYGSYFTPRDMDDVLMKYIRPRVSGAADMAKRILDYATGARYSANPLYDTVAPYIQYDELFYRLRVADNVVLMSARTLLCHIYSWAIPSPSVLREVVELLDGRRVVEIGAGRGYWAKQLARLGVPVAAYDASPPGPNTYNHWAQSVTALRGRDRWHQVTRGGTHEARRHADHVLMLCWPPGADLMAYRALRAYLNAGGETVLYIGDSICCGEERFENLLEKELHLVADMTQHPQWFGTKDTATLWSTEGR